MREAVTVGLMVPPVQDETSSWQVDEQASLLHAARLGDLTGSLRDDPAAVRAAAEQRLVSLGLVRIGPDGGWVLSPVAGRYRPTDGQP